MDGLIVILGSFPNNISSCFFLQLEYTPAHRYLINIFRTSKLLTIIHNNELSASIWSDEFGEI